MTSSPDDIAPGASARLRHCVTTADLDATASLTGDTNPIHCDLAGARQYGQSRRVAHGVFLLGLISQLIGTKVPGPGTIWFSSEVEFKAPVHAGDWVEASVTVRRVSPATNVVVLDIEVRRLPNTVALTGQVKVKAPAHRPQRREDMKLDEMTAVVTGGTRGIGEAITRKFAANGLKVVVSFGSDEENAKRVVSDIQKSGGAVRAVKADITQPADVKMLFDQAVAAYGKVDVIVNNATPSIVSKSLADTSLDDFTRYFNAYVLSSLALVKMALPGMCERKFGRVINVLTSALSEVPQKMGAYITAKSALYGLSRAMAVEFGPLGIHVNMVSPSTIISERTDDLGVSAQESIARKIPLRRLGEPEEVAELALFLVGKSSSYITGANIPVTGGILQ